MEIQWGNVNNRVISDQINPATVSTDTTSTSYPPGGKVIVLASPCPASITAWQSVEDTTLAGSPIIGSVANCVGSTLTLVQNIRFFTLGSGDTLEFFKWLPPIRRVGLTIKCDAGDEQWRTPIYDCNNQIGGSTIPLILPSSGSMGNNGSVTLTTALDSPYASAFFYMPASAIASGWLAGNYYGIGGDEGLSTASVATGGATCSPGAPESSPCRVEQERQHKLRER